MTGVEYRPSMPRGKFSTQYMRVCVFQNTVNTVLCPTFYCSTAITSISNCRRRQVRVIIARQYIGLHVLAPTASNGQESTIYTQARMHKQPTTLPPSDSFLHGAAFVTFSRPSQMDPRTG